jgi:hypothetical protein
MCTFRLWAAVALIALAGVLLQNHPAAADEGAVPVRGTVLLKDGQPLQGGGRIFFHLKDGQFVGGSIKADGTFKVDRVPVGKHGVTLEGKGVPGKFSSEENPSLEVEVTKGNNEIQIQLD